MGVGLGLKYPSKLLTIKVLPPSALWLQFGLWKIHVFLPTSARVTCITTGFPLAANLFPWSLSLSEHITTLVTNFQHLPASTSGTAHHRFGWKSLRLRAIGRVMRFQQYSGKWPYLLRPSLQPHSTLSTRCVTWSRKLLSFWQVLPPYKIVPYTVWYTGYEWTWMDRTCVCMYMCHMYIVYMSLRMIWIDLAGTTSFQA